MSPGSKFLSIVLIVAYVIGFLIATLIIFNHAQDPETKQTKWDQPWVPAVARRDACAMLFFPVFFLLPAILWPLVVAGWILVLIVSGLWLTLGSATSCCGIPLPRKEQAEGGGGEDATPRDLEMGDVAGGEDGDASGGDGQAGSDQASVSSAAASAESERPPPYASLEPDEGGERETDGLLGKGAE